jgi:hypothetical protein
MREDAMTQMAKPRTGIYAIRNKITGERYVGKATDVAKRWREHRDELARGTAHSPELQAAWRQYGTGNFVFEVLEDCAVRLLEEREDFHMREGCAYNHVQPWPAFTVDASSPVVGPLLEKLDSALKQSSPQGLAAYEAELDAEEHAEEEAERSEEARIMAIIAFAKDVNRRCKYEKIAEPELAKLASYVGNGLNGLVLSVAKHLSQAGQTEAAERLLLTICAYDEDEASKKERGVSPLPYERLAILYRKAHRFDDEIEILKRFERQRHSADVVSRRLLERLSKAQH